MRRLILMRHTKSDWSSGSSDHNRPLNLRGQQAAIALGDWLRAQGILPDQVMCSSAARTRATLAGLALAADTPATFTRDLYLATHHDILEVVQRATGQTLLVLGHNPGVAICAAEILASAPDHPQFERYPTGATLVADFDIDDWQHANWRNAIARHFTVPRDL